jgi:hypothetical protein
MVSSTSGEQARAAGCGRRAFSPVRGTRMSGDVGVLGLPSTSSPVGSIRDQLQRSALRSPRHRHRRLARRMVRPQHQSHHPHRRRPGQRAGTRAHPPLRRCLGCSRLAGRLSAIEAAISELIDQLRSQVDKIEDIHPAEDGRHTDQWSFTDVKDLLATELPAVISTLARAQRLTVAD